MKDGRKEQKKKHEGRNTWKEKNDETRPHEKERESGREGRK